MLCISLYACQSDKKSGETADSAKINIAANDSAKTDTTVKSFKSITKIDDAPICSSLAKEFIENYRKLYKDSNTKAIMDAYTESSIFGKEELVGWIKDVEANSDATRFKIIYGVYNVDRVSIPGAGRASVRVPKGKFTVFLWPFNGDKEAIYLKPSEYTTVLGCPVSGPKTGKEGEPVDPFNIAGLEP